MGEIKAPCWKNRSRMRELRRKKRSRLCADGPARNVRFRAGSEACQLSFTRFPENHDLQNPCLTVMPSLSGVGVSGPRKGLTLPAIHAALGPPFRISARPFGHQPVLSGADFSFSLSDRVSCRLFGKEWGCPIRQKIFPMFINLPRILTQC